MAFLFLAHHFKGRSPCSILELEQEANTNNIRFCEWQVLCLTHWSLQWWSVLNWLKHEQIHGNWFNSSFFFGKSFENYDKSIFFVHQFERSSSYFLYDSFFFFSVFEFVLYFFFVLIFFSFLFIWCCLLHLCNHIQINHSNFIDTKFDCDCVLIGHFWYFIR